MKLNLNFQWGGAMLGKYLMYMYIHVQIHVHVFSASTQFINNVYLTVPTDCLPPQLIISMLVYCLIHVLKPW